MIHKEAVEVQWFKYTRDCDSCVEGKMISTGMGFGNNIGSYYEHKCDRCGFRQSYLGERFPRTEMEII